MVNCELFSHVTLLCHRFPEKAHILTHLVNLSFGPKSGFKNKYRARACVILLSGFNMKPIYNFAAAWSRNSSVRIYQFNLLDKQR